MIGLLNGTSFRQYVPIDILNLVNLLVDVAMRRAHSLADAPSAWQSDGLSLRRFRACAMALDRWWDKQAVYLCFDHLRQSSDRTGDDRLTGGERLKGHNALAFAT